MLALAACAADSTAPASSGRVQVLLTDAPADMLESAHVWISRVYLVGPGGAKPDTAEADSTNARSGKLDLFHDPGSPLVFDLLQLRDGITADLTGEVEVDATSYQGLRFVVDSARVTLADGLRFTDGAQSGTLRVPSGMQSGIKVKVGDVLTVVDGGTLVITVDFDVDDNFVIHTKPSTGEVTKVMFKPVLKERSRRGPS